MLELFTPILKTVSTIVLSLSMLVGVTEHPIVANQPAPIEQQAQLGANISVLSDFRSSLAAAISSSATEMTLSSFTSGSETLTIGEVYGFKLGGSEYVLGTASTSNKIVSMTRGVSRKTGTTTVAAYQSAWGRGTSVEITDAPILLDHANKISGTVGFDSVLKYASGVATTSITDPQNLVSKALLDYTAFNGAAVIDASLIARGVSELATQTETASSTSQGSTGVLVIPASNATSTYNAATAALRVVVTKNDGKIDDNFIATSTLLANLQLATTTQIGAFPAYQIGKNVRVITTTGTSTIAVPSGITKLFVEVWGGGGYGPGCTGSGSGCASSGGGEGGYAAEVVDVTGTSTIQVFVGLGGVSNTGTNAEWTTFGTNGFYLSAGRGLNGSSGVAAGGTGGCGSGGDVNMCGAPGGFSYATSPMIPGNGGGKGGGAATMVNGTGTSASGYSGGGSGCMINASNSCNGGNGAQGLLRYSW